MDLVLMFAIIYGIGKALDITSEAIVLKKISDMNLKIDLEAIKKYRSTQNEYDYEYIVDVLYKIFPITKYIENNIAISKKEKIEELRIRGLLIPMSQKEIEYYSKEKTIYNAYKLQNSGFSIIDKEIKSEDKKENKAYKEENKNKKYYNNQYLIEKLKKKKELLKREYMKGYNQNFKLSDKNHVKVLKKK